MKKGFFLSLILMILFFISLVITLAIKLSYQYVSSATYYQRLISYHYISKSILKLWHANHSDKAFKGWIIVDKEKKWYIHVSNDTVYLMDDEEPKGKIIYYYEEK